MPIYTPQQALKRLQEKHYETVYFIEGEEIYYIDLLISYISQHILTPSETAFNLTIFYGKEHALGQIINQALRYPIGAERQVVIVKEAQDLLDLQREAGQSMLMEYLQKSVASTMLVFAYKYKIIPAKAKWRNLLVEKATFIYAKPLYDNQIPTFIKNYLSEIGHSINMKAINMLHSFIGNDLGRLTKELDKVLLNIMPGEEITEDTIQQYVGISKQFNIFELQNAIAIRDIYHALYISGQLLGQGGKGQIGIPLITILTTFFCKLLIVQQKKEKDEHFLAKEIQVHPFFIAQYITASKKYSTAKIMENLAQLQEADKQLKGIATPFIDEREILKELVFKLLY